MCKCTHCWMYLQVDGSELDGLSFGVVQGGVEGVGADGGVEDGGLLAGHGGLVRSRFGQHRDGVLRRLNGGCLQQLARGPLGGLTLMDHKLLLLLLLVLLNQGVGLDMSVRWNEKNMCFFLFMNSAYCCAHHPQIVHLTYFLKSQFPFELGPTKYTYRIRFI